MNGFSHANGLLVKKAKPILGPGTFGFLIEIADEG